MKVCGSTIVCVISYAVKKGKMRLMQFEGNTIRNAEGIFSQSYLKLL